MTLTRDKIGVGPGVILEYLSLQPPSLNGSEDPDEAQPGIATIAASRSLPTFKVTQVVAARTAQVNNRTFLFHLRDRAVS